MAIGNAALKPVASSTGFEIETHESVPAELTKAPRKGARKSGYPFDKLAVNQSFFVPTTAEDGTQEKTASRLQSSIAAARSRLNFDHENMREEEKRVRGGGGKTEMRKVPTPLPADKQRDFRARAEVDKAGVKGVRVYRVK